MYRIETTSLLGKSGPSCSNLVLVRNVWTTGEAADGYVVRSGVPENIADPFSQRTARSLLPA